VGGEAEGDAAFGREDVGSPDETANAVHLLIDQRLVLAELAAGEVEDEVAAGVDAELACSREIELDDFRVGARRNDEVVLEAALVAVENDIYAGLGIPIPHPCEMRDTGAPAGGVVAEEIVAGAGQRVEGVKARAGIGSEEIHGERDIPFQAQHGLDGAQKQGVAGAACQVVDLRIGLSGVALESQRQIGVVSEGGGCGETGQPSESENQGELSTRTHMGCCSLWADVRGSQPGALVEVKRQRAKGKNAYSAVK
jgi:hypothetical protein